MNYGELPEVIGEQLEIACREFMFYQYLPLKLAGQTTITREDRLACFDCIIGAACCDYIGFRGLNAYVASHVYLTAKHMFQQPGCSFNRPGWHADGFLTNDINYVWSDCSPTVFNSSRFQLTPDDSLSMIEMEAQAEARLSKQYPNNTLLRLNQFCIHKVADTSEPMLRTFVKISISPDRYDLVGNSRNYQLQYDWPMRERSLVRNVPQRLESSDRASR